MTLELRQEHRRRAHWYGAEAAILEKEANKLMAQAKLAKDRYFSELAKAGELTGAVYMQGSANAQRLDISGWHSSFVGIEGDSFTLREFLDRLGITEKDCAKAFRRASNKPC